MKGHEPAPSPNANRRRLSRSFKLTQQTQTSSENSETCTRPISVFKTPTRPTSSRVSGAFSGESPHESDAHHDIIWDATSPSPQRLGKRAKKRAPGVVNISDIVSRIAPEHGRPKVSEPALQQWIGDSAAIPCTPDVQVPKSRRKSPRSNGVDDLLKLAKEFDLNLFRHDDEEAEQNPVPVRVLSKEGVQSLVSSPQPTDDDLNFLFDESTQHASTALSSFTPAEKSPVTTCRDPPPAATSTDLLDDWEGDDLLYDSLLSEMTQNPENFCGPKHSSTQKTSCQAVLPPPPTPLGVGHSGGSKTREEAGTTCSDVRLPGSSPDVRGSLISKAAGKDLPNSRGLFSAISIATKKGSTGGATHKQVPAAADFPDDDLDAIFASEPLWDDSDDDEMLRDFCEDMESQIGQNASSHTAGRYGATGKGSSGSSAGQRTVAAPTAAASSLPQRENVQRFTFKRTGNLVSMVTNKPGSMASNHPVSMVTQKTDFMTTNQPVSMATNLDSMVTDSAVSMGTSRPVSEVKSKAVVKCSALEIERKKQQAMERRRRRLREVQNIECAPQK
ncbi:ewing's tumor-associated antigen 1 [Syngnathoides biaculeatus]|uniref:ewing's tumor-associated antigen 1 n=1 Tax=Syngnathoides biaculeatus TaxID=300417 RepID=UPI002ADDB7D0|nr:ewing's tumor-associated antigen 1 [Syngnathoides biaculeatus]